MRERGRRGGKGVYKENEIVIFGKLIRGRIDAFRKLQHQAKGIHCRGGTICVRSADQRMGT